MKKLLLVILTIVLASSLIVLYQSRKDTGFKSLFSYSFCDKSVTYKIGTIDPRFNITADQLLKDTKQAGDIWNKSYTKTLFVYDPQATLTVNMVFDERQSLNNQINQLKTQLDTNQKSLKPEEAQYEQQSADFKKRLASLNAEISDWNSRGGAPEDVYKKLQAERDNLLKEADRLNETARKLNLSADNFNSQVSNLNQKVQTFNQELTVKPEEGKFIPNGNRIEIYFNINQKELIHTLAHEFGHARGLDHNQNPKSIMYPNTTQLIAVSAEDIRALDVLCKNHNIWEYIQDRFGQNVNPQK